MKMAKIIVTKRSSGVKVLVDTNSRFERNSDGSTCVIGPGNDWIGTVNESIEEIQKSINEVEAHATNKKLDEILENQRRILERLSVINGGGREVISCVEY